MSLGYVILSKVVPCSLPSCFMLFPEPHSDPQSCLYNLLEGQPENSWPLAGKCCIISNLSRYSALHLPCFLQHVQQQHLSVNPFRVGNKHTMPARNPSVGIPSKAVGFPGIMFATWGISPAGCLGPDPYNPSPKVINIPPDQIPTPLLWNIWPAASYQFVFKPITNSYNQDPAPL